MKRNINRILKINAAAAAVLTLLASACNKYTVFDGAFVAFDTSRSSTVSVNAAGEFTGEYAVHYSGKKPDSPVVVTFTVTPGDGLSEGVDYNVATAGGRITFLPGVYDQTIKIDWLPHAISPEKDNTVTISLTDAGDATLGMPGPDSLYKDITIRKYTD